MDFENILYKEESFRIIGACMKVHTALGPGFLESVYHEALENEFKNQEIEFDSKRKLQVYYNNVPLKK